ncbi:MAG: nitroreductase family protein [Mycobacterium sp.]
MSKTTVSIELIKKAVELAGRAPSLHNSQPWQWVIDGDQLRLHLDRSRIVRNTDRGGREALISCGAALDHLRVSVAASGWQTAVERFPDPNRPDHLVTVQFRPTEFVSAATRARAGAILSRRTDRLPFLAPDGLNVLVPVLTHLLDDGSVRLDVLPDEYLPELIEASALTEATRRQDAPYQAELDWWTAPFDLDQGIPPALLNGVADNDQVPINRNFPASGHASRRPGQRDEAVVFVLSTPEDTPADALACGEALSTVLLECTAAGLATCTVSHLTELPAARMVVTELIGRHGVPQVLIRVGRVAELREHPVMTPRRELRDILRVQR